MDELGLLTGDGGLFTTAQARKLGFGRRALQSMVANRALDQVCRGVYALPQPDLSTEETHLRLARAGLLLYPDAAISHVSTPVHWPVWLPRIALSTTVW